MKTANQRSLSFVLLVSLFLQSCGVEPIAVRPGEHAKAQDSPTVSGSPNYFTIPPELQGRGEEALQVRSANTSPGASRPTSRASTPADQRAHTQDQLTEYVRSDKITSTEQLINAFDNPQPYAAQEATLQAWLRAYVERFQSLDFFKELTETALINHLEEYKELSRLRTKSSESRRELLRNYFHSLYDRIFYEATGHREKPLMQTFVYVLRHIDASTFVPGDVTKLQTLLTEKLLPSVDPSKTTFTNPTYETHGPTLEAIYEILRIIRIVDPTHWSTAENSLYQKTKQQLAAIVEGNQHYPTCYHAHILSHSLDQYREEENILSRLGHGIRGVYALYKFGVAIQGLIPQVNQPLPDFESIPEALDAFRECYGHFREATAGLGKGGTFYDHHQALQLSGALTICTRDVATCREYYDNFKQHLIEAERFLQVKHLSTKEDRTALRYLTVRQLTLIAVKSQDAAIRQESLAKLTELGTAWIQHLDADREPVVYELLNGLALIHSAHENQAYAPSLDALKDLLGRLGTHNRQQHARSISNQWLGSSSDRSTGLTSKLASLSTKDRAPVPVGALFTKVKDALLAGIPPILPMSRAQAMLRTYYQHPEFTKMVSFLEETPMFVQDIECHLKLNEQIKVKEEQRQQDQLATRQERLQWVKTAIALEDLFKPRSLKPDEPTQDIKKALLVGEAGTGKTSLTKKLAHDWAVGKWGQTFDAVYVLPVRNLRQDKYNGHSYLQHETLATAIANECFTGMREERDFTRLRERIAASLKELATLLILDGLDEQLGTSAAILNEAKHGQHKLLLTSRPYGIEAERSLVDIEVDHMGLDTSQRDRFVQRTLDTAETNTAAKLLDFIQYHYLTEMSQVPVNLLILCSLWKAKGAELQKPGTTIGLPGLYRKLVNYVWERFERKGSAHQAYFREAERERLFRDLEKIALTTLQRGEIIIDPSVIQEEVLGRVPSPLLKDAGFLLFEKVSWQYQFPHLTFHEYFAGRRLARQFLSGDPNDLEEVTDFLRSCMYIPRYRRTLSFMAGEVAKGMALEMELTKKSLGRIQSLLRLVDQAPREMVGVQHLVLQLRLLNEWLLTVSEEVDEIKSSLTALEQEFVLGNRLSMWFKEALRQSKESKVLLKTLTDLLGETSAIVKNYSDKLLPFILNTLKDSNSYVRSAALEALLTLVDKDVDVHIMIPSILNVLKDTHYDVRSVAISTLQTLAVKGVHVQGLIPAILNATKDSIPGIRSAALRALVEKGADVHVLLPPMLNALKDRDADVRRAAREALLTLVEKGADVQAMITPMLNALQDSNADVRSAAREALRTLVEK
ncbi:MAG: NACHT domain-containing protein, partial [Bacteroidota bacterium]